MSFWTKLGTLLGEAEKKADKQTGRRDFFRGVAGAAASAAVLSIPEPAKAEAKPAELMMPKFDYSQIGAGTTGACFYSPTGRAAPGQFLRADGTWGKEL